MRAIRLWNDFLRGADEAVIRSLKAELDKNWKIYLNRKYCLVSRMDEVT